MPCARPTRSGTERPARSLYSLNLVEGAFSEVRFGGLRGVVQWGD